jgi:hypothetical protein
LTFYYNVLTENYVFEIPECYSNDGTELIPEDRVLKQIDSQDGFMIGHEISFAGKKTDENVEAYIFDRERGVDTRELVSITNQDDNFVVVIESLHNGMMSVGSGVLATKCDPLEYQKFKSFNCFFHILCYKDGKGQISMRIF